MCQGAIRETLVKLQELLTYQRKLAKHKQSCMIAILMSLKVACWSLVTAIIEADCISIIIQSADALQTDLNSLHSN